MEGVWYDRSAFYEARRQEKRAALEEFAEVERVHLTPIPCWQGLSDDELREWLADLLESIEREHAERRRREGKSVLGAKAVCRRHPHDRPKKLKRSPAPRFHAATKDAWLRLRDAYNEFAAHFREAAELLKLGHPEPDFPEGSFPPGMPYVPHQAPG
jgi:hypothetical protein